MRDADILDTIGNTPLIEIRHLNPNPKGKIVAVQPHPQTGGLAGLRNIRDGFIPPIIDLDQIDVNELASTVDSFIWTKKLALIEGNCFIRTPDARVGGLLRKPRYFHLITNRVSRFRNGL